MAGGARGGRFAFWGFAVLLVLLLALANRSWLLPWTTTYALSPASIVREQGLAYTARLPETDFGDARTAVFEGRAEKHNPLGFLDGILGWSRVHYYIEGLIEKRFPSLALKVSWTEIGPGEQLHDEIRHSGSGRYSVWKGTLYFSIPDRSNPKANGRSYKLEVQPRLPGPLRMLLAVACLAFGLATAVAAIRSSAMLRAQVPGLVIAGTLVAVAFVAGEIYLRVKIPFLKQNWPAYVHPAAGFLLKPGEELRHTNNADFWIREKANSLGFLDREPKVPKPAGTFRILFLGDSFVEAAQVPIARKFHVLLEQRLRQAFPGRAIDTVAMGYSGTGQASQIPFYETFAKALQPDLVVALFVSNDFANNSPVLESVRNGWHPYHPPRPFLEVEPGAVGYRRVNVDLDYQKHLIQNATADRQADMITRIDILRRDPAFARQLEGWPRRSESPARRSRASTSSASSWRRGPMRRSCASSPPRPRALRRGHGPDSRRSIASLRRVPRSGARTMSCA